MSPRLRGGAALLAAVLAAGCGASSHSQRPAVAAYVKQINKVESSLTAPLQQVTRASASFATELHSGHVTEGPIVTANEQSLRLALTKIRAQQARLLALPAPAPAQHLRSLLISLTAGEAAMTHQVSLLVDYLPRFNAVLAALGPAAAELEHVLSRNATGVQATINTLYATKAAALRRFQTTVQAILARLRKLQAPAVSKPGYTAQIKALTGMNASAGKLAHVLTSGNLAGVNPALISFDRAALASRSIAVQKAQIAAIRAYDGVSKHLAALQRQISLERLALDAHVS